MPHIPALSAQHLAAVGVFACAAAAGSAGEAVATPAAALRIGWPSLSGATGGFAAPSGNVALIDDMGQAAVLWKNDDLGLGRAKGGSKAYRSPDQFTEAQMAKMGGHPGNWAGPILAEGMVISASWRPTGPTFAIKADGKARDAGGSLPVRLDAEDIVVAVDALTGKERWRAAEPGGWLRGGGKREGFQVGPVAHAGVVYSFGSTARIFAHELATGRKLWESDAHPAREAQRNAREAGMRALAAGTWPGYDLNPTWHGSLNVIEGTLIVPDQRGGLIGVSLADGKLLWKQEGVIAVWASPSAWRDGDKEFIVCANEKGVLRLIDAPTGKQLWSLEGLGPTWFTLTPGKSHVLVNVLAGSGKPPGKPRQAGRLGAIKLSRTAGQRAWEITKEMNNEIPVWMDNGARVQIAYDAGRFLVPHYWQNGSAETPQAKDADGGKGEKGEKESTTTDAESGGTTVLLLDEASGRQLASLAAGPTWDDQLGGLVMLHGDRVVCHPDAYHGPKHGGPNPWIQFKISEKAIVRVPGTMDLGLFTNGYEVSMSAPMAAGLLFERTESGGIVCYDLRAKR